MFTMTHLPVYQHRKEILFSLKENQVIVVESPTGSGKTTQIPLILHEAGYTDEKMVGITQPRRIATLSVSEFIEKQIDKEPGFVGYKMRFSDTTEANTKIKVMTDGMLLMELKADPLLSRYSVMLVDEAHERSLNIDFVLGLLHHVLAQRPDFKLIISSATINTKVFSSFYNNAPIIKIDSRPFPVTVNYKPLTRPYDRDEIFEVITSLVEKSITEDQGDLLIFLPGEFDIKMAMSYLQSSPLHHKMMVLPLFGRLSKEEQHRVFIPTPQGKTKVVVATNIAETSITIDGIKVVIDSGVAKVNYYNQMNFTSSLVSLPISRSSCEQRSGRAGRVAPGVCYRLYTKEDYNSRHRYALEEILRVDLSEVVLRMSELGIYEYESFPFITKPKKRAITSAEETLKFIGAIDDKRHITDIGDMMVRFPLLPRHSRVLVEAMVSAPNVLDEVITAVAFLSSKSPFILPPGEEAQAKEAHRVFNNEMGDFISYLEIYERYLKQRGKKAKENWCKRYYLDIPSMGEIHHVKEQLSEIVSELGFPLTSGGSQKEYLCCLATGLLQNVCIRSQRNIYQTLTAGQIFLHPGSAWFSELPQYILAGEIVQTSRLYARTVSPLKREWLNSIHSDLRSQLVNSLKKGVAKERKEKPKQSRTTLEKEGKGEITLIYKHPFQFAQGPKGKRRVVIIPVEELAYLARANKTARTRPKNIPATLSYQGHYIHYGDRLQTILDLDGKLFLDKGILEAPPKGVFYTTDLDNLYDNLEWVLALCRLKKRKKELGFIFLEYSASGVYRFGVTDSAFEALDNSLYALTQLLYDVEKSPLANRVQKLFNQLVSLYD
ncbi:MAG: oligonucleotide/oligosaccharide-binding fold domain-containing protein [Sphaerochaetaceae bacterium]|jgi:ATP-dependent helicase HrpA